MYLYLTTAHSHALASLARARSRGFVLPFSPSGMCTSKNKFYVDSTNPPQMNLYYLFSLLFSSLSIFFPILPSFSCSFLLRSICPKLLVARRDCSPPYFFNYLDRVGRIGCWTSPYRSRNRIPCRTSSCCCHHGMERTVSGQ